jgi:adenylate cyclase class 2
MASKDIEIEIKIPTNKQNFDRIRKHLLDVAKLLQKEKQVDTYYTPSHRNFFEPKEPYEYLRIRREESKSSITYKLYNPDPTKRTHCEEYESQVTNTDSIQKIFKALDFEESLTIDKDREIFNYQDKFEVALDKVKDLGYYIEIETTKDFDSIEQAREELFKFAKELQLDTTKVDNNGYVYLMLVKKGLAKT